MPRLRYSLAAEITKPLAITGSPDVQGELVVEIASASLEAGAGPAWVSGWASTSVAPDRVDLPRTAVQVAKRKCVVPVASSKASGNVTVQMWESWEKADAAALIRSLSGILSGRDIEATGTLGLIDAAAWEPSGAQEPTVPDIGPQVPPSGSPLLHATTFLRRNASISSHVLLSDRLTDAKRQEIIDYNKAQGYGVLYVYCANEGDYDKQSVAYDHSKRDLWRKWLGKVVESSARVIMWGCADDSNNLAKRTQAQWRDYWGLVHADCGDLISEWVTGLECDERWSAGTTQTLTRMLKEITGKPVGVHTTGLSKVGHAAGADKFYLQTGFGKSPAQVADLVRQARSRFNGPVIAAEYHKSGESDEAKAIGDAAIAAGAAGVGNGCTAKGLSQLQAATGWQDSSPVAPPSPPTGTPGAALTFRYVGGGQRDVSWAPSVDRSGWPTKSVDGATCDGLLYGCKVGGEPRKIEWIKRGQQSAHTKNAWAFAKDRKYNQGWAGGERVRLEIRDVAGNAKGHGGEVVLA